MFTQVHSFSQGNTELNKSCGIWNQHKNPILLIYLLISIFCFLRALVTTEILHEAQQNIASPITISQIAYLANRFTNSN